MRTPGLHLICGGFIFLSAFAASAADAAAQGLFVEGGPLLDYDPTLRSQTMTTSGLSVGAGLFVTPRFSVRVEFELPRWHGSDYSGRWQVVDRIEAYSSHQDDRTPVISLLFGYRISPASRVSVTVLAGAATATPAWRDRKFTDKFALDGTPIEHREFARTSDDRDEPVLSFGAEANIALTRHLAVVPQVRLHSYLYSDYGSLMFFRPRVSLRWQF